MIDRSIGTRVMDALCEIFESSGLTQSEVAERSGGALNQSQVSRLLRGMPPDPGIDTVIAFAGALGVNFADILAGAMDGDRSPVIVAKLRALGRDLRSVAVRLDDALSDSEEPEDATS